MGRLARTVFWWLAVPLLGVTILGFVSYLRLPQSLPPAGDPVNPSLRDVMGTLKSLFVPLFGQAADVPTVTNVKPIPILMYHYIRDNVDQTADPLGYGLSVPPAEFAEQLESLVQNGYSTVTMDQIARGEYDEKSIALTFDDGYKDFIEEAYPLLQSHGFTATVYIITDRLHDSRHLSAEDIVYLANRGILFGSHSVTHSNLAHQSAAALRAELVNSKQTIENITNQPVQTLSYPSGQYSPAVEMAAKVAGYTSAVTVYEGLASPSFDLLRLSRIRMKRNLSVKEFERKLQQTAVGQPPTGTDRAPAS